MALHMRIGEKGVNSGKNPNIDLWMGHKTKYYLVL